jgi:hypothetical protein
MVKIDASNSIASENETKTITDIGLRNAVKIRPSFGVGARGVATVNSQRHLVAVTHPARQRHQFAWWLPA